MQLLHLISWTVLFTFAVKVRAVQYQGNPTSEMSADDNTTTVKDNKTVDQSDESGHEVTDMTEGEENKDKKFLDDAMKNVLGPAAMILKTNNEVEAFKYKLEEIENRNVTLESFMDEMDKLSLEVCKTSQKALWSYVTDINNEFKKNKMVHIAAEEDNIKKQYWNILKNKYLSNGDNSGDPKLKRKIRIIKERGTNVQMPQSKQRQEIDTMQRIWSSVAVCSYNATTCGSGDTRRSMSDIITIFKTSNDSKELAFYWKAYRDQTGRMIRPIFKDYITKMNNVAESESFADAGEMWRYAFDDTHLVQTVDRIWAEVKPTYDLLHHYVRTKLLPYYKDDLQGKDNLIPAHILGNLWAQEWQALYSKVVAYPDSMRPTINENKTISSKDLFDIVNDFYISLGLESAKDSYEDIKDNVTTANCLPSSHDMCDGIHYKIKWCGEKISDVAVVLSRAARLLGHVQYFRHYRNLPPLYRDGPNPAFHDAISDIGAIQLTSPHYLKTLHFVRVDSSPELTINHLLWLSLEKFPLMAYSYILDKWRWDVFANGAVEDWNQRWWNLRIRETGISPPVTRSECDLDPAAKYHVVSHVQSITYLVSHVLEFQVLRSLCRRANHSGPLHECSIHGVEEAGKLLSAGMSLGARQPWRVVLRAFTGQTELSTEGILEYFAPLRTFFEEQNAKVILSEDMATSVPITVGVIVILLTIVIVVLYCIKRHRAGGKVFSLCGLSTNGSLDIVRMAALEAKAEI